MNRSATLAELAVTEPGAARVFYRNGLDFCCGGRRPLEEVCAARGLDTDALLAQITAEGAAAPASPRWDLRPLPELVTFIVDHYHQRLRQSLPELIVMAEKVESRHGDKPACPQGLAAHLHRVHAEVLDHLMKEEGVLFPMIVSGRGHMAVGPVQVMEMEHDDHKRNLDMLRTMTTGIRAAGGGVRHVARAVPWARPARTGADGAHSPREPRAVSARVDGVGDDDTMTETAGTGARHGRLWKVTV